MNVTTVTDYTMPLPNYSLPMSVDPGLDQRWVMYSPTPAQFSYWFTIPGVMQDGTQVDLLAAAADQNTDRAAKASWDKPDNVNETFRDISWLRYLTTLTMMTTKPIKNAPYAPLHLVAILRPVSKPVRRSGPRTWDGGDFR